MDKVRAAAVIRERLAETPGDWREHFRQEATNLERTARTTAAQETPFEAVIKKLKGATSMIRIKVWCEGPTDRPIFGKLFRELGEDELADKLDFVAGWPTLISERQPERWLDGCREAVIIMDGDVGRKLTKKNEPLKDQAKEVELRFTKYPLTLKVLRRYGIENYLPQHAYEKVLARDLSAYFPIPPAKKIEDHFCEVRSFYQKKLNDQVAEHVTMADIEDTDLGEIIREIKQQTEDARRS